MLRPIDLTHTCSYIMNKNETISSKFNQGTKQYYLSPTRYEIASSIRKKK
jgi:hypothetical protein